MGACERSATSTAWGIKTSVLPITLQTTGEGQFSSRIALLILQPPHYSSWKQGRSMCYWIGQISHQISTLLSWWRRRCWRWTQRLLMNSGILLKAFFFIPDDFINQWCESCQRCMDAVLQAHDGVRHNIHSVFTAAGLYILYWTLFLFSDETLVWAESDRTVLIKSVNIKTWSDLIELKSAKSRGLHLS